MKLNFNLVVEEFEGYIKEYSFIKYRIGSQEIVYLIEDSIIEHLSIREENYARVVIEEIFAEGLYDLKLKKFEQQQNNVQYFPYYGRLGYSNPYYRSYYEKVNTLLPELNIEQRFNNWLGFAEQYLVFELTEEDKKGYAVHKTSVRQTLERVMNVGNEIMLACVMASSFNPLYQKDGIGYFNCGTNYSLLIDSNMRDIILQRMKTNSASWRKESIGVNKIGIEEKGMKYCWIVEYIKSPEDRVNGKIIEDIRSGLYSDVDWYEYILPENKWKSEQLVYQIVKQMYSKAGVWYQFRPEWLRTNSGQLSYDIYISKLRVAIEYQGKQHFEPVEYFGGKESFEKQVERDNIKRELSKKNNVKLIYINYWEDITPELIRQKIEE